MNGPLAGVISAEAALEHQTSALEPGDGAADGERGVGTMGCCRRRSSARRWKAAERRAAAGSDRASSTVSSASASASCRISSGTTRGVVSPSANVDGAASPVVKSIPAEPVPPVDGERRAHGAGAAAGAGDEDLWPGADPLADPEARRAPNCSVPAAGSGARRTLALGDGVGGGRVQQRVGDAGEPVPSSCGAADLQRVAQVSALTVEPRAGPSTVGKRRS